VATLVPNPLTPVEIGKPVQLVRVPEAGVPRIGVVELDDHLYLRKWQLVQMLQFLQYLVTTLVERIPESAISGS